MKHGPDPESEVISRAQTLENGEELFQQADKYCPSCYTFSRDLLVLSRPDRLEDNEEEVVEWKIEIRKLADATENGCEFCAFVASRYFDNAPSTFTWTNSIGRRVFGCCPLSDRLEVSEKCRTTVSRLRELLKDYPDAWFVCFCQTVEMDPETREYSKLWLGMRTTNLPEAVYARLLGTRSEIILEVYAKKNSPAAKWISTRPLRTDFGSKGNISVIKAWIDKCIVNHDQCSRYQENELPSRVIEILNDGNVRLYEPNSEKGKYIALSYCWGGKQIFVTTKAEVEDLMQPFSPSKLSQAVQDAITTASRLGVRYIWIDALCIVQDSEDDMNRELVRMANYYKQSYLTIIASTVSCAEGFLGVRKNRCENHPESTLPKDLHKLPVLCPNFRVTDIYFREENPYFISREPISKRAWTFQECFLSPRVLMFGGRVIWQCRSMMHSDGGAEDWSFDEDGLLNRRIALDLGRTQASQQDNHDRDANRAADENSDGGLYQLWHRAVQEFSGRKLSYQKDKLPALSAAAAEFSRLTGDAYLAGLWKSRIPRDLLWSSHPDLKTKKPNVWRAPSWSWASIENQVSFERLPPPEAVNMATIHSVEVVPLSRDIPFGQISSGYIDMTVPCLPLDEPQKDFLREQYAMAGPSGLSARDSSLRMIREIMRMPDTGAVNVNEFEFPDNSIMALLFSLPKKVLKKDENGDMVEADGYQLWGLVLEPTEEKWVYKRTTMFAEMGLSEEKDLPWSDFNVRLKII